MVPTSLLPATSKGKLHHCIHDSMFLMRVARKTVQHMPQALLMKPHELHFARRGASALIPFNS